MNNLHLTDINLYAVFVAWIIHTASGLLWFQPWLFGNAEMIIKQKGVGF
jgi:hypothetical protein